MIPGSANPLLLTSADSGYEIERSLRFNLGDSASLTRTPSSAGNRKKFTHSFWSKEAQQAIIGLFFLQTPQAILTVGGKLALKILTHYQSMVCLLLLI